MAKKTKINKKINNKANLLRAITPPTNTKAEALYEKMLESNRNSRSDGNSWQEYGTGKDSKLLNDKDIRKTLNKAGYNIKQDTSAAKRFKKRYGK